MKIVHIILAVTLIPSYYKRNDRRSQNLSVSEECSEQGMYPEWRGIIYQRKPGNK